MYFRIVPVTLDKSASPFRHALQYAFYDWTRDMPRRRRIVATLGLLLRAAVLSGLLIAIGHHAIAMRWVYFSSSA
jgi:DNA-binding transcriptional LysR family regulator